MTKRSWVTCLDLEGILIPEIWIAVAKRFRVKELMLTTRDIPNYDRLMRHRLRILKKEKITLPKIRRVIGRLKPLAGAKGFLKKLQAAGPVIVLSDTFYEFAGPLMRQLDDPTLFCNSLVVDRSGRITGYRLRQKDGKRKAVRAIKGIGFKVRAVGDSFNDLTMLKAADRGIFFRPPAVIRKAHPNLPAASNYAALLKKLISE
ncbi:MAG: bifunctional phosphoserine phosphatase/homoserine phosphotransferase ThrH [Candidatus Omnitrophica bacterium CG11_big_fil_rev_8_21_14_0_20_64_10]|nr:MAG: bifunctional phosphoserine phosphatase/homoserine phosphotransferase ThrH [Candidatus Omnitrophica bacterium CG11_big_fil_rev_8_21_14_0_20_64_10]